MTTYASRLGDQPRLFTLHVIALGARTNSPCESSLAGVAISTEDVRVTTLDDDAERARLGEVSQQGAIC